MYCAALLMDMFVLWVACLTMFVNRLVKQFAICLGVYAILLLNVMDQVSVAGGALLEIPCMVFQRISRCSFHMFCLCFVCRKLSPHLGV